MMKTFYNFPHDPFGKYALKDMAPFPSNDHKMMQNRLKYLVEVHGIGVFTAPPGMGKTHAIHCFEKSLSKNLYQVEYICLSTVSVSDFYAQLCSALGIEPAFRKSTMFKKIQEQILYNHKERRKHLVLVVDEAQHLSHAILNDLKMLMNFNYDSQNCFTLILSGEPYLTNVLSKTVNEALRQRVTVHYEYEGLSPEEVAQYVSHKLKAVDGSDSLVSPAALTALAGASGGNPRQIDNIMSTALTLGAQLRKNTIDADDIMAAVNELSFVR